MISCEVRDSHLILYLANEALYKGTYASVDLDTMQIAPLNLYAKENGEDVFVGIFAEGEKDLFVLENSHEKETITGRMEPLSPMSKVSRIMYSSEKKIIGIAGLTI